MTETQSPDIALFWNESLADELQQFLTRRLKCPEAAADLTHETYLHMRQWLNGTPPDNARAVAFRIAVNLATDYQRKIKVRNNVTINVEPAFLADISTGAPGPEQIVMANQRLRQFHDALAELPADCRRAFLMHGVEGLTYAEIGERLGISESMVYKHLARAVKHSIKRMKESE